MKFFLGILSVFCFSISAFAVDQNSSWQEIRSQAIVNNPYLWTFGQNGIFNMCATKSNFKSITPITVCTKWEFDQYNDHYPVCVANELRNVTISRNVTKKVCAHWGNVTTGDSRSPDCLRWEYEHTYLSQSVMLSVYGREETRPLLFEKEYMIPACK
ncbi:MAG TPA: hypothetical protein VN132_14595 [Bdellovibrio sp.]|nr:hypothetical protein [Bdellovibrio sp.]